MERVLSDEEKIRRAIEISQRRTNNNYSTVVSTQINVKEKKNYRLLKKMMVQIMICLLIYTIFYLIATTNYSFSVDMIKNTNQILNYDINFKELYNNFIIFISTKINSNEIIEVNNAISNNKNVIENNEIKNTVIIENNYIQEENVIDEDNSKNEIIENENKENVDKIKPEEITKTQMELDVEEISKLCKFQKPLNGTITSEFGDREAIIDSMTTDHKGIDIAANSGTNIKAVMEGVVEVAEENSEYGKFVKIVNGNIMTVYAHCKSLKVKVGDKIKIGQTIATVGSTGVSTGPHLHLEIRYKNRYINPRLLIQF